MNQTHLSQLAQARQDAEFAKQRMNEIIEAAKAKLDYQEYEAAYRAAQEDIDMLTAFVKDEALQAFNATGEKQLPGVTIKIMKRYVCTDESAASAWVHDHPEFISVNWKALEAEAKKLYGSTFQLPFYEMHHEPTPQIKSDLSEFIQPEEA